MVEDEGYSFRRIRFAVGDREVWLEWNDRPDGTGPLPFTLHTLERGTPIEVRIVTEADEVGWRRAPDPAEGPESDSEAGAGPGPEEVK
jgi:hypothetical protein